MVDDEILNMAEELGRLLVENEQTVTTAESCTGGGLAYAITSVAGSSAWFNQSLVTYSNNAKQFQLGVCNKTLNSEGAVSEQTVKEMAFGALEKAHADLAISVSGIAGPGGGSADKPVGIVWFGIAYKKNVKAVCQRFSGDRAQVRFESIKYGLRLLIKQLQ